MRAVLDPNIIISGLLSPTGTPAELLRAFGRGQFELIASQGLLGELERALAYPKLQPHIGREDAEAVARWIRDSTSLHPDPATPPPVHSPDPGDDYLIALASVHRAALVSKDKHLLGLSSQIPIFSAREFLDLLARATLTR